MTFQTGIAAARCWWSIDMLGELVCERMNDQIGIRGELLLASQAMNCQVAHLLVDLVQSM